MKPILENESIKIWLKKVSGSEGTRKEYINRIKPFIEYYQIEPDEYVETWKKDKYDYKSREQFLDELTDKVETYIYNRKGYAPTTQMQELTVIMSFFKNCCARGIPIEPKRMKHVFVKYHNRDITREEIERILENSASLRDKTFFLMMLESGMRPSTLVQLRYRHIKRDFEAGKVPMMIELPSDILKGRVPDRFTFIGEDGFKILKKYLKPRIPLQDEDLLFTPERKDIKHEFLVPETFSVKFGKIVLKLGIAKITEKGKPRRIRLYCLRKYFNNNIRADRSFIEWWMCHKTTTPSHYTATDVERHREEYANAYENLRIYTPPYKDELDLHKRLLATEKELKELREQRERQDYNIKGFEDEIDNRLIRMGFNKVPKTLIVETGKHKGVYTDRAEMLEVIQKLMKEMDEEDEKKFLEWRARKKELEREKAHKD